MLRFIAAAVLTGFLGVWVLSAQEIPRGYEVIRITETPFSEFNLDLNSRGQIVFAAQLGPDANTREIFMYDDETGQVSQLTDNDVQDNTPSISEDGTIAWIQEMGPHTPDAHRAEIMVRTPDGVVTRLTDNDVQDASPDVNSSGQIAWSQSSGLGCTNGRHVMFFDGRTIRQITDNEWSNQGVQLNERSEIIWTEYDFCPGGGNWRSLIKLYVDGEIITLSRPGFQSSSPTISNHTACAWRFNDPDSSAEGIHLWQNGETTLVTDWGHGVSLNDAGQLAINRWHNDLGLWHVWTLRDGEFFQLSNDSVWNANPVINSRGEIAWSFGPLGRPKDIRFMRRFDLGDLNCDGSIDAFDIEGFLLALLDPEEFAGRYPRCDALLADINQDGSVNAFDIEPFIELLFP